MAIEGTFDDVKEVFGVECRYTVEIGENKDNGMVLVVPEDYRLDNPDLKPVVVVKITAVRRSHDVQETYTMAEVDNQWFFCGRPRHGAEKNMIYYLTSEPVGPLLSGLANRAVKRITKV